eukprot:COSAG06_NODE_9218_length_1955_cov_1.522091_3_plen_194_part_01
MTIIAKIGLRYIRARKSQTRMDAFHTAGAAREDAVAARRARARARATGRGRGRYSRFAWRLLGRLLTGASEKPPLRFVCKNLPTFFLLKTRERLPWHAWGEHTRTRLRNERRFPPQGGSSSRPRSKKDAAFKAKLRADNARLQEEIERLRNQLYTQPGGAADGAAGPPGTPPLGNVGGDAAATAQQQEEQQEQQ